MISVVVYKTRVLYDSKIKYMVMNYDDQIVMFFFQFFGGTQWFRTESKRAKSEEYLPASDVRAAAAACPSLVCPSRG